MQACMHGGHTGYTSCPERSSPHAESRNGAFFILFLPVINTTARVFLLHNETLHLLQGYLAHKKTPLHLGPS